MFVYIYLIVFAIISIWVLISFLRRGFRRGFARELLQFISILAAILTLSLVTTLIGSLEGGRAFRVVITILILAIAGFVYKLVLFFLKSIRLIAALPVIHGVDRIFGAIMGLIDGFCILYLIEYILTNLILK